MTSAYRELGPKGGIPLVFFVHLAATFDNWDPRIIDPIAAEHHVIAFDNRGVGASNGSVPDSIEAMANDAVTFIKALGFDKVDIFSFSLGGMIAQALVMKHPGLVRKLVLTGTGPAGGKDIDKVAGTTYYDMLRAALTRSDPKEFLFFNRNAAGKPAARSFVERPKERTVDRDAPIAVKASQTQLKAIKRPPSTSGPIVSAEGRRLPLRSTPPVKSLRSRSCRIGLLPPAHSIPCPTSRSPARGVTAGFSGRHRMARSSQRQAQE